MPIEIAEGAQSLEWDFQNGTLGILDLLAAPR